MPDIETLTAMFAQQMTTAAMKANVKIDEKVLPKIAKARVTMGVDMSRCPCASTELTGRGCVGKVCMKEMLQGIPDKNGRKYCHCHCFYLEEK